MSFSFAIPIGGGIPAGVILGQHHGIGWLTMSALYLVSDIALACVFEPTIRGLAFAGKRLPALVKARALLQASMARTIALYGSKPGPVALIAISFGVDPMTGRAAALANGHGFLLGWVLAILGDMLFFFLIMTSTIWLDSVLGDGTWTTLTIMSAMLVIPAVVRRVRARPGRPGPQA